MFERVFTPVLAFTMLASGTFAIGHELFAPGQAPAPAAHVALVSMPTVAVTGHRASTPLEVAKAETARSRFQ
jgi:hypothetical protein